MSQQQKLERVLDLLLNEDSEKAAELLHQIIVEKARVIYENIVEEDDEEEKVKEGDIEEAKELDEADDVGGEPSKDFTMEISSDKDEIDQDEESDGEPEDEPEDKDTKDEDEDEDEDLKDKVDDLQSQLEELRADFDEIMAGEMSEPEHAEMADDTKDFSSMTGGYESPEDGEDVEEEEDEEEESVMYEKKKHAEMEVAPQTKKKVKGKRADEETQFLNKVADTGQRGTAKLVGAGTNSKLGAEQDKSTFTNPPSKRDYGGKPVDFGKGTGGEYGKYHGEHAKDDTPSDNVDEEPKKSSYKADTTAKYTGGKVAGDGGSKSPFTKKPGGQA